MALERAFRGKFSVTELGYALINFSHGLQVNTNGDVYRVNRDRLQKGNLRRKYKQLAFYNSVSSAEDPFIKDCLAATVDTSTANVIAGIRQEGAMRNQNLQAKKLVQKLQAIDENDAVLIGLECLALYTCDSFLSKSLNKFSRERDYTKMNTLGPFLKLLYSQFNKFPSNVTSLKVYRGEHLRAHDLRAYKRGVRKKTYRWLGFTSTSKSEEVAKTFIRNAFFIIYLEKKYNGGYALDIQALSNFNEEDEVLFRPGVEFSIDKLEYDKDTNLNTFYLTAYI